jgi:crotonobetainyl-CoA:carnitine CoA-transferase CaiB-like acyl-CoA transferase
MDRRKLLIGEKFGPLQGTRIISSGVFIAGPFASEIAAEWGAEVIHVERAGEGGDPYRLAGIKLPNRDPKKPPVTTNWIQERRNMLGVTCDPSKPRGRDLFLRLLGEADAWIESSKPGTYARWGLDDATILKVNPRLVITHISGYGHSGDPDFVKRACVDSTAQAFGGMMYQAGFPDPEPPVRAQPWTADYISGFCALSATLACIMNARAAGQGQAIDVAMFEVIHKIIGPTMLEYFETGLIRERVGNRATAIQPLDTFRAKDGWLMIACALISHGDKICTLLGLDPQHEKWKGITYKVDTPEGWELDALFRAWVADHTCEQVLVVMADRSIPCAKVMNSKDMAEHPHYRARQAHIEWDDEEAGRVHGTGIVPKLSATPGKIWRGSPALGQDNRLVYGELLGLRADEIENLQRDGII